MARNDEAGSGAWVNLGAQCAGVHPSARAHGTLTYVAALRQVVLVGGTDGRRLLGDVHVLSLSPPGAEPAQRPDGVRLAWRELELRLGGSRNALTPRARHTAVAVGHVVYVFGGVGGGDAVFALDLRKRLTLRLKTTGHSPCARFAHVSVAVGESMFVVGGHTGAQFLDDVFRLCTRSRRWFRIATTGLSPPASLYYGACRAGDGLAMLGGGSGAVGEPLCSMWLLRRPEDDAFTYEWSQVPLRGAAHALPGFDARAPLAGMASHFFSSCEPPAGGGADSLLLLAGPLGNRVLDAAADGRALPNSNAALWRFSLSLDVRGKVAAGQSPRWSHVELLGACPPLRFGASVCRVAGPAALIVFGGALSPFESVAEANLAATRARWQMKEVLRARPIGRRPSLTELGADDEDDNDSSAGSASLSSAEEDEEETAAAAAAAAAALSEIHRRAFADEPQQGLAGVSFPALSRPNATALQERVKERAAQLQQQLLRQEQAQEREREQEQARARESLGLSAGQRCFSCALHLVDGSTSLAWRALVAQDLLPQPCRGLTLTSLGTRSGGDGSAHESVLALGGRGSGPVPCAPWLLERETKSNLLDDRPAASEWHWRPLEATRQDTGADTKCLPPLHGHTATLLERRWVVVFGGETVGGAAVPGSDVWVLDTAAVPWQWRHYARPPEKRPSKHLKLLGLRGASSSWPPARAGHAAVGIGGSLFIVGGLGANGSLLADVWRTSLAHRGARSRNGAGADGGSEQLAVLSRHSTSTGSGNVVGLAPTGRVARPPPVEVAAAAAAAAPSAAGGVPPISPHSPLAPLLPTRSRRVTFNEDQADSTAATAYTSSSSSSNSSADAHADAHDDEQTVLAPELRWSICRPLSRARSSRLNAGSASSSRRSFVGSIGAGSARLIVDADEASARSPSQRFGHSCSLVAQSGNILLFGGCLAGRTEVADGEALLADDELSGELFCFNTRNGHYSWRGLSEHCSGGPPTPRYGHVACVVGDGDVLALRRGALPRLMIYGGLGWADEPGLTRSPSRRVPLSPTAELPAAPRPPRRVHPLTCIYILDLHTLAWSSPRLGAPVRSAVQPSPRWGAALCAVGSAGSEVLLFGGCTEQDAPDAAQAFELDTAPEAVLLQHLDSAI
jgi:hypothetical protein